MVEYHTSALECQFCDEEFENSAELVKHIEKHTRLEIRPYSCSICKSKFSRKELLDNHKCQGLTSSSNLSCIDCKVYFQSEAAQTNHSLEKHANSNFCPICKMKLETLPEILFHVRSHFTNSSKITSFCKGCMQDFEDDCFYTHSCPMAIKEEAPVEEENLLSTDTEQIVVCAICGKEFPSEQELDNHISDVVSKATEVARAKFCKFCEVTFATRSSFEAHVISKHLSALQCPFCLVYISTKRSMEQHLLHHTNIHRIAMFCDHCNRQFFSQGVYDNHSCESSCDDEETKPKEENDMQVGKKHK
jgi:hypothetical protein